MSPKAANFDAISKLKSCRTKGCRFGRAGASAGGRVRGHDLLGRHQNGEQLFMLPLISFQVGLETLRSLLHGRAVESRGAFSAVRLRRFLPPEAKFAKQMRMSKQDIRDEAKEVRGKSADQNAHPATCSAMFAAAA